MHRYLIHQATVVNEGRSFTGSVLVEGDAIAAIYEGTVPEEVLSASEIVEAKGKFLLPGVIDVHVHFRDPGLTHKADLVSESMAAVAGGVTSFLEMPNTKPLTITLDAWQEKMDLAEEKALANYGFYLGATNENLSELERADYSRVCGVKVFMGSSTGNMLVGQKQALEGIFKTVQGVVAVHAESEAVIQANKLRYIQEFGEDLPVSFHPLIRSAEACYESAAAAVELATKWGTRLHIAHVSTARELSLFERKPLEEKRITAEVCVPHLWFDDNNYARLGNRIKCNPAIKTETDKSELRKGLLDGRLDLVATDHAPHTLEEKVGTCLTAASGMPGIQFSLNLMLEMSRLGLFSKELLVEKMCHAPATLFKMDRRGFIRKGYFADLVLIDSASEWTLKPECIYSKCGWSPFEQQLFHSRIEKTWVNGSLAYENGSFGRKSAAAIRYL